MTGASRSRVLACHTIKKNQAYRVLAWSIVPEFWTSWSVRRALVRTLTNAYLRGRVAHALYVDGSARCGKPRRHGLSPGVWIIRGWWNGRANHRIDHDDCEICRAISETATLILWRWTPPVEPVWWYSRDSGRGALCADICTLQSLYYWWSSYAVKNAFNALPKTLEEPPPHVKIFATTEIRKVPVTVLSRCQRFDLRRGYWNITKSL